MTMALPSSTTLCYVRVPKHATNWILIYPRNRFYVFLPSPVPACSHILSRDKSVLPRRSISVFRIYIAFSCCVQVFCCTSCSSYRGQPPVHSVVAEKPLRAIEIYLCRRLHAEFSPYCFCSFLNVCARMTQQAATQESRPAWTCAWLERRGGAAHLPP